MNHEAERPLQKRSVVSNRFLQRLWIFAGLFFLLPTLLSLAARLHWSFDLLTSFHVQYAIGLFPIAVLFCMKRQWWKGACLLLALGYNLALVLPAYLSATNQIVGEHSLRLLVTNVWSSNREYAKLMELIRTEEPDVVLALEVNGAWMDALSDLSDAYPYSKSFARADNFGIALFSKFPFQNAEILDIGDRQLPSVYAKLLIDDATSVTILGTHPLPPVGRAAAFRNQQLGEVATFAAQQEGHVILCGDLNLTPWSPHWGTLLQQSKLRDSRQGFGIQPSWPSGNLLLRIPIDHVLVSDDLFVADRRVGPNIGSDHFPIIIDLRITAE